MQGLIDVLLYVVIGGVVTLFGAVLCKFVGNIYKDKQDKKKAERIRNREHKEIMQKLAILEPMCNLTIYNTKTQLLNETKHYVQKGSIPIHKKSNLLSMCEQLHNLPHSNGDVTECETKLKNLPVENLD